jgi:hypothetical protein
VLFRPGISLCIDREQKNTFAEPDIVNHELKGALGDCSRADEHHALFCLLQLSCNSFDSSEHEQTRI